MDKNKAHALALDLMSQHGLTALGWKFKFDRAVKRVGLCTYSTKTISISAALLPNLTEHQVRMTLLHEIAHAHCGPRAGHGPVWRRMCLAIGGDGKRCAALDADQRVKPKWKAVCGGGHEYPRHRKSSKVLLCPRHPFNDERRLLTWVPNV